MTASSLLDKFIMTMTVLMNGFRSIKQVTQEDIFRLPPYRQVHWPDMIIHKILIGTLGWS